MEFILAEVKEGVYAGQRGRATPVGGRANTRVIM
jgi:hypothetical protein